MNYNYEEECIEPVYMKVEESSIIISQELHDRGLVRDVLIRDETWIVN